MNNVVVDFDAWPVVVYSLRRPEVDDADVDDFCAGLQAALDREGLHAAVIDMSGLENVLGARRRRISAWLTAHEEQLLRKRTLAVVVVPSALQRGIVTALNWVRPPRFPRVAAETRAEAVRIAARSLERRAR